MRYYQWHSNKKEEIPIGKVICLARTYKKHADEMNADIPTNPVIFLKPSTSIIFSGESIIYPIQSSCVHHEIEFGVIIGRTGSSIPMEEAFDFILGYCIGIDVTARDLQMEAKTKGLPWAISKGFDTFAPISDIVEKINVDDPHNVLLELRVNNESRQQESTSQLLWRIPELVAHISKIMTLERGDLILTGTPHGVSEIQRGDSIYASASIPCEIEVTVQ